MQRNGGGKEVVMEQEQRQAAKRQMLELMQAGQPWQAAAVAAGLQVSRSTCRGYFAYLFPNLEGTDHARNLITICLMHGWRSKGVDSIMIGALLGTDVSSSQYRPKQAVSL